MKLLKTNFPIQTAILSICFTVSIHAKSIGSRVVTACFEQVQLINSLGATLTLPLSPTSSCAITENAIINGSSTVSYSWLNAVPSIQRSGCIEGGTLYCCLRFDVDASAPAVVPNVVPQAGYASAKYKILYDGAIPVPTPRVICHFD